MFLTRRGRVATLGLAPACGGGRGSRDRLRASQANTEFDEAEAGSTPCMFRRLQELLDALVAGIEAFARGVNEAVGRFFTGLVEFVESVYSWCVATIRRIKEYLVRFFTALGNLLWALFKLSLFYVPSILGIIVFWLGGHWGFLVAAIAWGLFITGVGLTYGRKPPSP